MKKNLYILFALVFLFGMGTSMLGQEKTAKPIMKITVKDGKVVNTVPLDNDGNPDLFTPSPVSGDKKVIRAESQDPEKNVTTVTKDVEQKGLQTQDPAYSRGRAIKGLNSRDSEDDLSAVKHVPSLLKVPGIEPEDLQGPQEKVAKGQSLEVKRTVTSAVFDPATAKVRYIEDDRDVKTDYVRQDLQPEAGWEVIMSNDFETAIFPISPWNCFASGAADAYWDDQAYRANSGSWSLYCADNGANSVSAPGPYPTDMDAWAIYGPFDLTDASSAWLDFYLWLDAESGYDYFSYMASIDGSNFYGYTETGNTGSLWSARSFDMAAVPTLGNVAGNSSVYFALRFESDYIISYEGAYVDDVVLWKYAHDIDLHSTNIYLDTDTWEVGAPVVADLRVVNAGTDPSGGHYSRLYMSTNSTISTGDVQLGSDLYFSSIAGGGDLTVNHPFTVPSVADGTYYVGNYIDIYNTVPETDEANNTAVRGGQVTVTQPPDVDLYWTNMALSTDTWDGGLSVTATLTEANGGLDAAGGHYTRIYLSVNDIISSGDTQLGGDLYYSSVSAGGTSIVSETFTAPDWADGTYYIGAIVDYYGDVAETNESNNIARRSGPVYYVSPPDVDLHSTNIYLDIDAWTVGAPVVADLRVVNTGADAAGAHYSRLYMSDNSTISTGDVQLGGDLYFSAIAGGGDQTVYGHTFNAPDVPDGSYYVGNIIDIYDDIYETDESNNFAVRGGQVTSVHIYVDLRWTTMTLSSSTWVTGDMVTAGLTEENDEAGTAGGHSSRIYLSNNTTIDNSDTQLGGDLYFSSVPGGGATTVNHTFAVPSAADGTYYVGAIVDYYDDVAENDESNNVGYRAGTVDLVPQAFTISATVQPAGSGTVTGAGSYTLNQSATLVATAATGFEFLNWTETGSIVSSNPSYTFTVTADRNLVANFQAQVFDVTTVMNPAEGGSATGAGSYAYGSSVSLVATPAAGFDFVNWTVLGVVVSTSPSYTFTVTENTTAVANFAAGMLTVTVVVEPSGYGTVTGGGPYTYGTTAVLAAVAADGNMFVNWVDQADVEVSDANPYSFTVIENITLKAMFVKDNTGIGDDKAPSFELYPNPVGDKLFVKVNSELSEAAVISLYDVSGKVISNYKGLHHQNDVLELNTSKLIPGIYFIRITDNDADVRFTGKVIKQ